MSAMSDVEVLNLLFDDNNGIINSDLNSDSYQIQQKQGKTISQPFSSDQDMDLKDMDTLLMNSIDGGNGLPSDWTTTILDTSLVRLSELDYTLTLLE